jgi:hypothetical protein
MAEWSVGHTYDTDTYFVLLCYSAAFSLIRTVILSNVLICFVSIDSIAINFNALKM